MANETAPVLAPYEPIEILDTTDETRTDLPSLYQRWENEIAAQNAALRALLGHWDSILRLCSIISFGDGPLGVYRVKFDSTSSGVATIKVVLANDSIHELIFPS